MPQRLPPRDALAVDAFGRPPCRVAGALSSCEHLRMPALVDGLGHLSYVVTGDGPPVVPVHAGIADHRMWDAVVPDLAERHTVVRYDLRGFGESGPPTGPFRETDDLCRLLDHLGLERVRLVGASWGGRVAVDFGIAHPDRVHSLANMWLRGPAHEWRATSPPSPSPHWSESAGSTSPTSRTSPGATPRRSPTPPWPSSPPPPTSSHWTPRPNSSRYWARSSPASHSAAARTRPSSQAW
ncbi:alpha/beta fold hydrolase [Streptomyces fuscichromogenes]|uniref:alpha/beta fold hydrolase n=1 Tax=Streptomyces fuscichromogenes TaxID=1324013 RepID=UPI00382B881C